MYCSEQGCQTIGYESELVANFFIGGLDPLYLNRMGWDEESYEKQVSLALDMESEGIAYVSTACPLPA